jgi:putative spermidine/putrescine transport system substrate-binding protein
MALYADGVAIADVYDVMSTEEGIDRAFAKLDDIKDHAVFWSAGAKPLDLVGSGEVSMSLAYNGRIGGAILSEGADFHVVWDGQVLEEEWLVMLKGTQNYAEALHFMVHASTTEQQAGQAKWINYGPMRKSAIPVLEANEPFFHTGVDIMPHMPNTPALMENTIVADPTWWADNGEEVALRYTAWMAN